MPAALLEAICIESGLLSNRYACLFASGQTRKARITPTMLFWMQRLMLFLLVLAMPLQSMATAAQIHGNAGVSSHDSAAGDGQRHTALFVTHPSKHLERQSLEALAVDGCHTSASQASLDAHAHHQHSKSKCHCSAGSCGSVMMLPATLALSTQLLHIKTILQHDAKDLLLPGPVLQGIERPPRFTACLFPL